MSKKRKRAAEVPRMLSIAVPLAPGTDEAAAERFAGMVGAALDDLFDSMSRRGIAHPGVSSNVSVEARAGSAAMDVRSLH